MRVLVTGGTGYLGSAIVHALARHGHDPVVFARRATAAADLPGTRVDGDIGDRPALRDAARGAGAVIHTAALVRTWHRDPAEFDRVNVGGLETVIDVCAALGTSRLVFTSSFLALPPAGAARPLDANPYQRSKVRAREVARGAAGKGVPMVSLVPGVIYGNATDTEANLVGRLVRDHLAGRLPGIVGAQRHWSFAHIDDVAEAHVAALTAATPGDELTLGGENVPQMRLFEIVRSIRGTPLPRRIPGPAAYVTAWLDEMSTRRGQPPRLTRGTVKILQSDWPLDSARSVEQLNYRIRPLAQGVTSMLERGF